MKTVILASASRTRARILDNAGVTFVCEPASVDETAIKETLRAKNADAAAVSLALAEAKATEVSRRREGAYVIAADQILACNGRWFDKPRTMDEAASHLTSLRGQTHHLVTAACLFLNGQRLWRHVETARLTMRPFGDEFLAAYLERTGPEALQSVGAYQLEGFGAQLFSRIDGSYFTIFGLPLVPLLGALRQQGLIET